MLTPNIRFDDPYISSALQVSDLFTDVIEELKWASTACIKFQQREELVEALQDGFMIEGGGGVEGRGC